MTSKERFMSAVEHTRGARPPFYIMGFYEQESQERIQQHLNAENAEQVYDMLGIDVRGAGGGWS